MMPKHINELLHKIYSTGQINSSQADELKRAFQENSPYAVHMARLRLENDIAHGVISDMNSGKSF